jgi:organic radical activating enzyme
MTQIHTNACPALFLDATIDSTGSYSPCTALGGSGFDFAGQTFKAAWLDPKLEDARQRSQKGEQLSMCNRCWKEEAVDFVSERKYLIMDVPQHLDYTDKDYYSVGPRHLNIKVSNICNLRCRTCQSKDSYLYHIEGEHYEKTYNLSQTAYTLQKFKKHFTDQQLDELFEASENLERIELYGGEPFLDDQIPKYLIRLVDAGLSKNIDFSVSTNATHELTDTWRKILTNFKNVIINVSIDGTDQQFTYMRHPGRWDMVEKNLTEFFNLEYLTTNITVQPVVTVSALNVLSFPKVFKYFEKYHVEPFIILVQWPTYYCVNVLPDSVKPEIEQILTSYNNPQFGPIINLLNTNRYASWEKFKFWTQAKDQYRSENFITTFDDLGQLLLKHNEWYDNL